MSNKLSTTEHIRKSFIDFFIKNDHQHIASSPIVPNNDDTVLFTNAGMVQFKDIFMGYSKPVTKQAVTVQKCLRAGGKHNDLDNVGYTARHHTFFEMLGNFSFGSYFKEQAIYLAHQYLTNELSLPLNKLLFTVYETDDESYNLWKKISGCNDSQLIRINTSDNFWSMGETGPCGPCSEIYYDYGSSVAGGLPGSENEGDRYVEIWNLVFMQYVKDTAGNLNPIDVPSIDTGMGLERVASIMSNKTDNYEIDIFVKLHKYISSQLKVQISQDNIHIFKIISDHARAITFMIADGVLPSNDGRGYVLRRIIRRAMRYSYMSGFHKPLLYLCVKQVISLMGNTYSELIDKESIIESITYNEEVLFLRTISGGLELFKQMLSSQKSNCFSGESAFKLYDTYGFPLDLTQDLLKQSNMLVNTEEFNKCMQQQKNLSKASWKGGVTLDKQQDIFTQYKDLYVEFLGYSTLKLHDSNIIGIIKIDGNAYTDVNNLKNGEEALLLFKKTVFYAESGGQKSDTGTIVGTDFTADVINVIKSKDGNIIAHHIIVKSGVCSINSSVSLIVDYDNRKALSINHTATHLLHAALRQVLGKELYQKGSLISNKNFRFDVSWSRPITTDQIKEIENIVNHNIALNHKVTYVEGSYSELSSKGALALFGERYPENVRGVLISNKDVSFELCGGTHVNNTSEIGAFKIVSESSIASGVRRIEGITSNIAFNFLNQSYFTLQDIKKLFINKSIDLVDNVNNIINSNKELQKKLDTILIKQLEQDILNDQDLVNNSSLYYHYCKLSGIGIKHIQQAIKNIMNTINTEQAVIIVIIKQDNNSKHNFVISTKGKDAKDILANLNNNNFNGSGGGSSALVQGSCPIITSHDAIKLSIKEYLS